MNNKIKNVSDLGVTELRFNSLKIAEAGLNAIDTEVLIKKHVGIEGDALRVKDKKFNLGSRKIYVVGVGKCALNAAAALEDVLGSHLAEGIILDVVPGSLQKIKALAGDHPMPSLKNVNATHEIINFLKDRKPEDLIIFIVSGGGSTLLCQPKDFTFFEEANFLKSLFDVGATIQEINLLRKHLSLARGGYLAEYAYPAESVSLIFSDVPGDDLNFISSAPTMLDESTVKDALSIIDKYKLTETTNFNPEHLIETPKDHKYFEKVTNILIGSNKEALEAMAATAKELGFKASIANTSYHGEARVLAKEMVELGQKEGAHSVLLFGGESTVTIKGQGKGGRNQELALGALAHLRRDQLILSLASDGHDNTEFAGAICDRITVLKAEKFGLDPGKYLEENDAFHFFEKIGDYLLTEPTGSNMSDLVVVINE